jgi:hypothetical protein
MILSGNAANIVAGLGFPESNSFPKRVGAL